MKKIIATLFLLIFITSSLVSCNLITDLTRKEIRVGYMAGPTGMGMAKLISDNGGLEGGNDKYSFTKYTDTQLAKADLAAGKVDIICLPTNEAAVYFNTVDSDARILAVNCLNSLFFVSRGRENITSLSQLEGQTIYTCKNGTPRIVLEYILKEAGINATVSYTVNGKEMITPQDLSAQAIAGNIPNAVMPEPIVTSTMLKINAASSNTELMWSVKINFSDEWEKVCDTPMTMGCIVASGNFVKYRKAKLNAFLEEYKASVEYVGNMANIDSAANYVVETGVMGAVPAAKKALLNLNGAISYLDGEEMKNALIFFYNAIGVPLPDNSFYYEK